MTYEYKVVPAPKKGKRAKGVRGAEARFAFTLEGLMNELGADGWEYQRSDTLPVEARSGLTGKSTEFQNVLVFRRAQQAEAVEPAPAPVEVEEIAAVHAPALPSADAAQALPENVAVLDADKEDGKDVAAE